MKRWHRNLLLFAASLLFGGLLAWYLWHQKVEERRRLREKDAQHEQERREHERELTPIPSPTPAEKTTRGEEAPVRSQTGLFAKAGKDQICNTPLELKPEEMERPESDCYLDGSKQVSRVEMPT